MGLVMDVQARWPLPLGSSGCGAYAKNSHRKITVCLLSI